MALAAASAPGAHQESSSLKATSSVSSARTPTVRAAAPALRSSAITVTAGCLLGTAVTVPSPEALSTSTIGGASGSSASRSRVASTRSRRSRVAITMPAGGLAAGSPAVACFRAAVAATWLTRTPAAACRAGPPAR